MTTESRLGPEWEIPLHMPRSNRAGDVILALIVAFFAIVFLGGMAALFIGLFGGFWGYLFGALIGVVAAAVLGSALQTVRRSTRRPVRLRLFPDALEIDHYLRFRRPFRVPKERIKSVIVDAIHTPAPDLGERVGAMTSAERKQKPRLPVIGLDKLGPGLREQSSMGDFLYDSHGSPLPLVVSELKDLPNLAIVFDEPIALATARRSFLAGGSGWPTALGFLDFHLPSPKRPAPGFLARALDPYKAYVTFDAWGVLPTSEAVASDVVHAFPTRGEVARMKATRTSAAVGLFVAILVLRWIGESVTS